MISKDRLLAGLKEILHVEEGSVTLYTNFCKVLLKQITGLDKDIKRKIEKSLNQLYRDSTRHRGIVEDLINNVRKTSRDEY